MVLFSDLQLQQTKTQPVGVGALCWAFVRRIPSMLRLLCALLSANAVAAVRPYNGMEGQRAHVAWQISVASRC